MMFQQIPKSREKNRPADILQNNIQASMKVLKYEFSLHVTATAIRPASLQQSERGGNRIKSEMLRTRNIGLYRSF